MLATVCGCGSGLISNLSLSLSNLELCTYFVPWSHFSSALTVRALWVSAMLLVRDWYLNKVASEILLTVCSLRDAFSHPRTVPQSFSLAAFAP